MDFLIKLIRNIKKLVTAVINDNISIYAAQASFFIVISAVPFIMLLLTLVQFFLPMDEMAILRSVNSIAPETIADFLTTIINELFNKASSVSIISITAVTTLWLSSKGVMALYLGLNNVFNPEKKSNYFYSRFISVIYTLFFIIALLLTIVVFGFGSKIENVLSGHSALLSVIISFLLNIRVILFTVLLTLGLASFYRFLPHGNSGKFKYQIPGALCAAGGWMLFSFFYSIYIEYYSNYSYVYGSLTAIVFLMLWLYFCMNIFLCGAEINKLYVEQFKKKY